jgi:HD superfamily phosphohydrolase
MTHNVTDINADKLVCRRLFPDETPRSLYLFYRDHSEATQIKREWIESLNVSVPSVVESRLSSLSQVTLKDMWLGRRQIMSTRWQHSVGVYNIGEIWLKTLIDQDLIPNNNVHDINNESIKLIAGYSLLLHDYGHMFFSHLLDEALSDINWIPAQNKALSLDIIPIRRRLQYPKDESDQSLVDLMKKKFADVKVSDPDAAVENVISLIEGTAGIPWLQSIINGPIDADKIDYIGRDHQLLQTSGYSVSTRTQLGPILAPIQPASDGKLAAIMPWFSDFLYDQCINHSGFLCLRGRSALAAADIWRERIFLYDRFYLSPSIRVADRIVLEILQQFLIRSVISEKFGDKVINGLLEYGSNDDFPPLAKLMENNRTITKDIREIKYEACRKLLGNMTMYFGKKGRRDFDLLVFMEKTLFDWHHMDDQYQKFLHNMFTDLGELCDGELDLRSFANHHIVQQPLQFPRELAHDVREIVRSLQHQYYRDVLIDVCVLPSVLSPSPFQGPLGGDHSLRFNQLLVPKGEVSKWGPGSHNLEPLTPSKVKELERPYGRVVMISQDKNSARSKYSFDKLIGAMRSSGIPIEEVE